MKLEIQKSNFIQEYSFKVLLKFSKSHITNQNHPTWTLSLFLPPFNITLLFNNILPDINHIYDVVIFVATWCFILSVCVYNFNATYNRKKFVSIAKHFLLLPGFNFRLFDHFSRIIIFLWYFSCDFFERKVFRKIIWSRLKIIGIDKMKWVKPGV
jgi:hypothetical protein